MPQKVFWGYIMTNFLGIEYARGATATITNAGPALAPRAVQKLFPNTKWTIITAPHVSDSQCLADRFGDAHRVHHLTYNATPDEKHIMIGGDHSVNYGHFIALADMMPGQDLCLVYIDAHLDIHTPETSKIQATGSPHGTNVRALLGQGDDRWIKMQKKFPALRPENLFFLGTRSYEPAEMEFIKSKNIYFRTSDELRNESSCAKFITEIRDKIGDKPFVVSFDFDVIDPTFFPDVLVPETNGIDIATAKKLLTAFKDAYNFEFVEYAPSGNQECEKIAHEIISIAVNS